MSDMTLVVVEATFGPDTLATAAAAIEAQAETVRAMEGCARYTVYTQDAGAGLSIVQKWQNQASFDSYRNSATFGALIGKLKPLMTAPPVTTVATCAQG